MSIDVTALERLLATPSGGWRIPEMTSTHSALPALLRLARAAHRRRTAMLNNRGTHEDAIECSDADAEERAALDAFDFTIKEPAS